MEKKDLKPGIVFHYFEEVCQVPRPSKKEDKIRAYLLDFAEKHGLSAKSDEAGNVLITKPATVGKEHLKTVILQSHMDMVCEKNKDTQHNFETDPIETYIDGEWLRAKGTTLGADNGIGVATELAILASDEIEHGPIQCLFTVDEETGLTGAFALKEGFMEGDILINLDSEDEGELFIGCAGGAGTTAMFPCTMTAAPEGYFFFRVAVKGLTGGHSGDDINKNRANANKLLNRYLVQLMQKYDLRLCEIDGGNLHNAIPREAHAVCAVPMKDKESVRVDLNVYLSEIENEYAVTEPNLELELESESPRAEVMDGEQMKRFLLSIYAVHNGVYAMSQDIAGLVETSSNLASVKQGEGYIKVVTSQRSSILSSRVDMSQMVSAAFVLGGASVETGDGYPGWKPNPSSEILHIAVESYKRLFGVEPKVKAIHAGLECGLFLEKYPSLDMVSFGPTLRGVHSPDERMLIPTVDKFWRHLLDVLVHIPAKA
ncbi:aminoacyl-histidine dipeptidase [Phocaeicola salanitronis]|uniref:aminoacyl-histidine dipeptidase n=1 Tax=Phocaeicola salanitronis TaxID=376805 RepID=UPI0025A3E4C8|nr:aminoacyl-histidine dipeptidase [Phocaeicola salanitronis]MDM8304913.1 aminoacyl-histidine dipeptidase [Phocaeicola salanitronis]